MFLVAPIQEILSYCRPRQKLMFILRDCLHGGRKIVAPGRSYKEDHPCAIFFLYSVCMQKVVPVLALGSSYMRGRKILVLETNQTKMAASHLVG